MVDQSSSQIATKTLQDLVIAFGTLTATVGAAPGNIWAAFAEVPLASGTTITPDLSSGFNFGISLGSNAILENPVNAKSGQSGSIYITQTGSGGWTMAYGTAWQWVGGTAPTLTAAAGAVDVLKYTVRSPTAVVGQMLLNVKA